MSMFTNIYSQSQDGRSSAASGAAYPSLDYQNAANPYLWLNAATNPAAAASLGIFFKKIFDFYIVITLTLETFKNEKYFAKSYAKTNG